MKTFGDKHIIIIFTINWISKFGRLDNMPKRCFENFPWLKSSQTRVIIPNILLKFNYRSNKHSYDILVTTLSLQCKKILKNFVVNEKTGKIQQQEKSRSLSTFAEKHARDIDQRDISALHRPLYKRTEITSRCAIRSGQEVTQTSSHVENDIFSNSSRFIDYLCKLKKLHDRM
jgi:hypothetical protein